MGNHQGVHVGRGDGDAAGHIRHLSPGFVPGRHPEGKWPYR